MRTGNHFYFCDWNRNLAKRCQKLPASIRRLAQKSLSMRRNGLFHVFHFPVEDRIGDRSWRNGTISHQFFPKRICSIGMNIENPSGFPNTCSTSNLRGKWKSPICDGLGLKDSNADVFPHSYHFWWKSLILRCSLQSFRRRAGRKKEKTRQSKEESDFGSHKQPPFEIKGKETKP